MAGPWERFQGEDETQAQGAQPSGPWSRFAQANTRPPQPDYSFLEERGLGDDQNARELLDVARSAQTPEEQRRAQVRLAGYLDGRDAISDEAGAENAVESAASRAETGLRGFGQGAFGLGDFSAALGSWIGDGGPFGGDLSLRDHFAYQRQRREGMSRQNPVTSTTGYLGGAVLGGGGIASGATRAAARAPGVVGATARNVFQRIPGRGGLPELGRAAAGSGVASGTAAALEGGDAGEVAAATGLGAVAGPIGERVLDTAVQAGRGLIRRLDPERAAVAALRRRGLEGPQGFGRAGARGLADRVAEGGPGSTIAEALNPRQAERLGREAGMSGPALDELQTNIPEAVAARAPRVQRAAQGPDAPISTDAVRAQEATRFGAQRAAVARETAEDVRGIRRERNADIGQRRALGDDQRAHQNAAIREATERLQQNLARTADTASEAVTPQALTQARKEYADAVMGELGEARVNVPDADEIFGRDAVRNILRRYAGSVDSEEREAIMELIERGTEEGAAAGLTIRQIDAFRRAADNAAANDPELSYGLGLVADELTTAARTSVPAYGPFLDTYSRLSRTIEGATRGFQIRGAQISQLSDEARIQRQAEGAADRGAFDVGLNRASQRAVADEARRSPAAARRLAEQFRDEPQRFELGMGPRAERTGRVAQAGLDEIEEAETALRRLTDLQRADEAQISQLASDRAFARTAEGQDRIQALRERMQARVAPIRRAENIVNEGSENFVRASEVASGEGMDDEFRRVARTALAEFGGEGGENASNLSRRLTNDVGLQRRVRAALGPEFSDELLQTAARENAGATSLTALTSGAAGGMRKLAATEREALVAAVDAGVISTGRWSASFGVNAFLRVLRLLGGDQQRAFQLARALSSGDRAVQQRTLNRLGDLGASLEEQKMFARAAGAGTGIATGQGVAGGDDE